MEYEMKGGFLCPCRVVRQGGGYHLVPTLRATAYLWSYIPSFSFHLHHTWLALLPSLPPHTLDHLSTHHGTRCMSGSGSLYFQVFVCGVSSPAAQWPVLEREKTREAEKAERGRGSCGQASGSRGESEILKRHKGRPHALKGNNSFTTEADSTWSDVWKFVCLLATRPIDFFSNRFFSFFTLLFPRSFFRASLIRITFILSNSRTTYIGVRTDGPAC